MHWFGKTLYVLLEFRRIFSEKLIEEFKSGVMYIDSQG